MRKVTTSVAAALVAFSFAACNKTNNEATPEVAQGNTYASLTIAAGNQLRAETDNVGRDAEGAVKSISLLSNEDTQEFSTLDTDFNKVGDYYKTKAFKTKAGSRAFALVLNKGGITLPTSFNAVPEAPSADTETAATYASDDNGFVMTSKVATFTVQPKITEADVEALTAPDAAKNGFELNAERVVAQGIVTTPLNTAEAVATKDNLGALTGLKYGGAMGAKQTYIFGNYAGERTMGTANKYANYKSYVDAVVTTATYDDDETTDKANREKFQLAELTDRVLVASTADYSKPFEKAGYYFFENSVANSADQANLGAHRNAYAKVYGVYTPKEVWTMKNTVKAQAGTGKYFDPATGESKGQADAGVEGIVEQTLVKVEGFTAGTTFFMGETDGVFYASSAAAKLSKTAPGQMSYMYEKGMCVYRMPWNQVKDGKTTIYADTRRNNIYVVNVTAFEKIGMNYDPNDPQDPNIPKPNNPDEPTTPPDGGDPSWDESETYAAFFTKILPWNVVNRDVTLNKH